MSFLSDWVNCLIKEKKESGTIKTYLGTVKHYLNFCMLKHPDDIKISSAVCKLTTQFSLWNKNLYKGLQKRKHVKKLEDLKNFPTALEIKSMDTSEAVKHAKRCLANVVPGAEPRMQTFITIRDYVMSMLIFNNCSRPGGIYNMNLGEFCDGEEDGDGGFNIQVFNHKTDYEGPVNIHISSKLYNDVLGYLTARNNLIGMNANDIDPVFVSFDGNRMGSTLVTSQFKSFWRKAIDNPSATVNPTI